MLKARLDEYNDEWRTADTSDTATNNFPSLIRTSTQNKSKKSTTRKYKRNADNNSKNDAATTNGSAKETNKNSDTKRKRQKVVCCVKNFYYFALGLTLIFYVGEGAKQRKTTIKSILSIRCASTTIVI